MDHFFLESTCKECHKIFLFHFLLKYVWPTKRCLMIFNNNHQLLSTYSASNYFLVICLIFINYLIEIAISISQIGNWGLCRTHKANKEWTGHELRIIWHQNLWLLPLYWSLKGIFSLSPSVPALALILPWPPSRFEHSLLSHPVWS